MDKELIQYCKDNKFIFADYTHKFKHYSFDTLTTLHDILCRAIQDKKKYEKVIIKIILGDIHPILQDFICECLKIHPIFIAKKIMYIHKEGQMVLDNDVYFNNISINQLFNKNKDCCVCLEDFSGKNQSVVMCEVCNASYHKSCIQDPRYPWGLDCCICKTKIIKATLRVDD